jgi:hypothetical protein
MSVALLSSQLRSFMSRSLAPENPAGGEEFNRLALALFAFQRENVPIYRELCQRRKAGPESVADWRDIPAVPTRVFKEYEVSRRGTHPRLLFQRHDGAGSQPPFPQCRIALAL